MELQQVIKASAETPAIYPLSEEKSSVEVLPTKSRKKAKPAELSEREEFVERIEAYCDCV